MNKTLTLIAGIIIGLGIAVIIVLSLGERPVRAEPVIRAQDTITWDSVNYEPYYHGYWTRIDGKDTFLTDTINVGQKERHLVLTRDSITGRLYFMPGETKKEVDSL